MGNGLCLLSAMTTFEPRTPHSDSIVRPACDRCTTQTRLFGVEPDGTGKELLTFVCPKCEYMQTAIGPTG